MEKVRISMRTISSYEGLGPRVVDLVMEIEPSVEAAVAAIKDLYEKYFAGDSEHMVRACVTSPTFVSGDYLVAKMAEDGTLRVVPVERPPVEADRAEELRKLEASLAKAIVAVNAVEIAEARAVYDRQRLSAQQRLDDLLDALSKVSDPRVQLPSDVSTAWLLFAHAKELAVKLQTEIPAARYAVVDSRSGVPRTASVQ